MRRANLEQGLKALRAALRHPLTMVALPIAMLLVSHLGGEPGLLVAAVLVSTALAAIHIGRGDGEARHEDLRVLPGAEVFGACLEKRLRAEPRARVACLLIRPDPAEALAREPFRNQLRLLAAQLRPALRDDDAIARVDRDTLAVALCPDARLALEATIQTALRLQRRLDVPADSGAGFGQTGTRIGFALSRENDTAMCLVGRARAALETAGPGAIRCASGNTPACDELAIDLARDLPVAFAEGQIGAFYQPQFCTDTDVLSGVEALARWKHPRYGLLGPGQFLDTVVAADMMGALTEAMLSHALRALGDWDRIGLHVPRVSVNFPLEDLRDPTLVERIAWMLDAAEIAPERLGIEILESVLNLENDATVSTTLWRLRELGCFIDLDDFGTGNTSIANIRRFAVERLKIDRSFVRRIDRDADQRAMMSAILTMAEQLKIDTLAEGVETPDEHAILSQLGCRHVQGFGIGRPMPGDRLPVWLAERAHSAPPAIVPEALRRLPPDIGTLRAARAKNTLRPAPIKPLRPRGGQGKTA